MYAIIFVRRSWPRRPWRPTDRYRRSKCIIICYRYRNGNYRSARLVGTFWFSFCLFAFSTTKKPLTGLSVRTRVVKRPACPVLFVRVLIFSNVCRKTRKTIRAGQRLRYFVSIIVTLVILISARVGFQYLKNNSSDLDGANRHFEHRFFSPNAAFFILNQ